MSRQKVRTAFSANNGSSAGGAVAAERDATVFKLNLQIERLTLERDARPTMQEYEAMRSLAETAEASVDHWVRSLPSSAQSRDDVLEEAIAAYAIVDMPNDPPNVIRDVCLTKQEADEVIRSWSPHGRIIPLYRALKSGAPR